MRNWLGYFIIKALKCKDQGCDFNQFIKVVWFLIVFAFMKNLMRTGNRPVFQSNAHTGFEWFSTGLISLKQRHTYFF